MDLAVAIALAAEGFKNIKDRGGKPYILHCLRVMNNLNTDDEELQQIAVLHDVVEDEVATMEDLQYKYKFSKRVIAALILLTHDTMMLSYDDYIKRIATNDDARVVKLADLKDNSDISRLKGLSKKDFDRMEKYHRAYIYLSKV